MPGRSKPTKLKLIEGNPGKRPLLENEPKPLPIAPSCPSDLDYRAKRAWKRLAPKLERLGLLTETDGDMFAVLCQIRSRLIEIHKQLKRKSVITLKDKGEKSVEAGHSSLIQIKHTIDGAGNEHLSIQSSPFAVLEKQYYDLFRKYAGEFGLSPRGRVGLTVGMGEGHEGEDL